jgi:exopolysaccharide biosynthesis polyprenyl glycosylphosphotransferase
MAVLLLAFVGSYWLRGSIIPQLAPAFPLLPSKPIYPLGWYVPLLIIMVGIWLAAGYILGVYRGKELRERRRAVSDASKQVAISALMLAAGLYFVKGVEVSRLLLAGFIGLAWLFQVGTRLAYIEVAPRLREKLGTREHVLLVGTGQTAQQLASLVLENERRGLYLVGFVDPNGKGEPTDFASFGRPVWPMAEVGRVLRQHVVDQVFFAASKKELGQLEDLLLLCEEEGIRVRVHLRLFPHLLSRVYVEELGPVPLLTFSSTPENELHLLAKRSADVVGASMLLVLFSPLLVLLGAVVKLTSRGPILYRQQRCGVGGRRFTLYKFRSMVPDAEERRAQLEALNEAERPAFKMKNDPRCTSMGRWMRRFSLDELPQLWNVLKGDMSFVGPRPPLPDEVEKYERWQRRRLRMRPGLTCLWALEGRSQLSFARWMQLDLLYIDTWSLWLDLKIFLKTIPRVLTGRGAA